MSDIIIPEFSFNSEQIKAINDFIVRHNRNRKCPFNKTRNKKGDIPCGGTARYSIEIKLTAVGDLASIKCECGAEEFLGEV